MLGDTLEFERNGFGWENIIDITGGNGGAGHTVVLGRVLVLGESNAARRLDFLDAEGTVTTRSGKHHTDTIAGAIMRHRAEKIIDRHFLAGRGTARRKAKLASLEIHV